MIMEPREIILDGNRFDTLEGFYKEAAKVLTNKPGFTPGRNLDSLADLLGGGFGVHNSGEPITLVWKNAAKSRKDLGYRAAERHYKAQLTAHPERAAVLLPRLRAAKKKTGPTLFDRIIQVIGDPNADHKVALRLE